jgi:enolase
MPLPMMNIINGGAHADNSVDIQEFMILPVRRADVRGMPALRRRGVFHALKSVLKAKEMNTAVGDEGGFAPNLGSNEEALQTIGEAVEPRPATSSAGRSTSGLDVASTEFFATALRRSQSEDRKFASAEFAGYLEDLGRALPDRVDRGRHGGGRLGMAGRLLSTKLRDKSAARRRRSVRDEHGDPRSKASSARSRTASSCKPNQIGTLTGDARRDRDGDESRLLSRGFAPLGETEDATIADIAVATAATQIKTGLAVSVGPVGQV